MNKYSFTNNGNTRRKEKQHMSLKDFLEVDLYPEDPVVLHIYTGNERYQSFYSYVKDFIDDNRFCDCSVNDYGYDPDYGCRCVMCDGLRTVDYDGENADTINRNIETI